MVLAESLLTCLQMADSYCVLKWLLLSVHADSYCILTWLLLSMHMEKDRSHRKPESELGYKPKSTWPHGPCGPNGSLWLWKENGGGPV